MTGSILSPRQLPDGRVEWVENQDVGRWLRDGYSPYGWEGDPRLSLVRNIPAGRWEVWRANEDGTQTSVWHRVGDEYPGLEVISDLQSTDSRRIDALVAVEAHNAKIEADRDAKIRENLGDGPDRLAWALAKDLDLPAPDGKLYSMGAP